MCTAVVVGDDNQYVVSIRPAAAGCVRIQLSRKEHQWVSDRLACDHSTVPQGLTSLILHDGDTGMARMSLGVLSLGCWGAEMHELLKARGGSRYHSIWRPTDYARKSQVQKTTKTRLYILPAVPLEIKAHYVFSLVDCWSAG